MQFFTAYEVDGGGEWQTRRGVMHNWVSARAIDFRITRTPDGIWSLSDQVAIHIDKCVDLDFRGILDR